MKNYFKTTAICATAVLAMNATVEAYVPPPDVYVVFFSADWCGPCQILQPKLEEALRRLGDPKIEYLNIDITGGRNANYNANAVFDRGIVSQYNNWLGVTGFAAIIDGDTKNTLGCVNITYDTASMASHIDNLKSLAKNNQRSIDLTLSLIHI